MLAFNEMALLSRLEANLAMVDGKKALLVAGSGEVIEAEDGIVATGSGGAYALSAARALLRHTELPIREVVQEGLRIAAEICVYTNDHITIEVIE